MTKYEEGLEARRWKLSIYLWGCVIALILVPASMFLVEITGEGSGGGRQGSEAENSPTVEWFKEHAQERQATLETCANNPGELKDTPKCINAVEAERQLSSGSLRTIDNW